jgi:hypothetical protein
MYARLLAMLCLIFVSLSTARADSVVPASDALEVYVKGQEFSTPDILAAMSRELNTLMEPAGYRVIWRGTANPPSSSGAENLVIVELRGVCMAQFSNSATKPLPWTVPLASSSVVDGKVLPFSWVDCTALNRFLMPVASAKPKAEQDYLYGRSMARLLAHELYHVLGQTDDHTPAGIAKARFSTVDLLADHLDFETAALDRLRPPSSAPASADPSEAGR